MKIARIFSLIAVLSLVFAACQDKDYDIQPMALESIDASQITGTLNGDDYTLSWPQLASGRKMLVSLYTNGIISSSDTVAGNSYIHSNVNTNVPYTYVFKVTDGSNFSKGVVKTYEREGASQITGLQMSQA